MQSYFQSICVLLIFFMSASSTSARDIYVAKTGDNSADGSFSSPYLTLSKAAEQAQAGDVVYIREGEYEEVLAPTNSGRENEPIIFQSYNNEKVVISAMQALSNWQHDVNNVYVTQVDWDLEQQNFVMQGDTVMDLARWPDNIDGDPFSPNALRNTGGSDSSVANDAYLDYAPGIPAGDWSNGGSIYFYGDKPGSGWTTWRAFITASTDTQVTFELDKSPSWIRTFHAPGDKGDFFLQGIKDVLDYQNEWYFDPSTKKLYVQLPDGQVPADGLVKMRKRTKTIDLAAKSYIHIKNLAVFGGSIEITSGASHNLIYGVTSLYGNYTLGVVSGFASNNQSVNIRSDWNQFNTVGNVIENSEIGFGSGTGIYDSGESTQILNSYIHDFNYLGNYDAIINARGGNHTKVLNNTITRGGRDAIQGFNDNAEYAYNDISYSNLIADDCGLFYTVGGPSNTEIHHNWLHDAYSSGTKKKATGIYLDNDASGFTVHHNVIWNTEWSSIQINWNGRDINIYNNTMLNSSGVMGAWHKDGTEFSDVNIWNNIADNSAWEPQSDKQNNVVVSATAGPFLDSENGDFRLKPNTTPVDAGRVIDDITVDVLDGKPDAGAYELNGDDANWTAGISWEPKLGPSGMGCYGLPGEDCRLPIEAEPRAEFKQNQTADEGTTAIVTVTLTDLAASYPVTIPYVISGTASSEDHDAVNGEFVINSGTEASISIWLKPDDVVSEVESIIITMGIPTNAIVGGNDTHTITINDKTAPPNVPSQPTPNPPNSGAAGGGSAASLLILLLGGLFIRKPITRWH
ncbi:right-handed parallel beta-helix repeat-containing protein [Paraglaciecola aquimarina]|uniref:Right-handed parallel beta-helix repeat-containing protein n=1 Tax=Paraglaciecola aquimarina TaxID=1235557 RepID=A0ABU3SVM2_9ALTE|nr:right-handed parallel beta-helix repeat-containing protein [Paraglaciecola aquimarina]MDU0354067.1 right-handed parallel beta-helix repeat-containing protein [Paraglaciecola aquimarina]